MIVTVYVDQYDVSYPKYNISIDGKTVVNVNLSPEGVAETSTVIVPDGSNYTVSISTGKIERWMEQKMTV